MLLTFKPKQLLLRKGKKAGNLLFGKLHDASDDEFYCFAGAFDKSYIGMYLPEVYKRLEREKVTILNDHRGA